MAIVPKRVAVYW